MGKTTYEVQYQYLDKGAMRPTDLGNSVSVGAKNVGEFMQLPNIGDYVEVTPVGLEREDLKFSGRVRSRLFRHFVRPAEDGDFIGVTIVVEYSDDDWSLLIKE